MKQNKGDGKPLCYSSTFDVFKILPSARSGDLFELFVSTLIEAFLFGICGYVEQKWWTDLCFFVSLLTYPNVTQAVSTFVFKPR